MPNYLRTHAHKPHASNRGAGAPLARRSQHWVGEGQLIRPEARAACRRCVRPLLQLPTEQYAHTSRCSECDRSKGERKEGTRQGPGGRRCGASHARRVRPG